MQIDEKNKIYNFQKTDTIFKKEIFELMLDFLDINATIAKLYYLMG